MVGLQRLTAMRPGEAVIMRGCDLDTSGDVWIYSPHTHKGEHHGRGRTIYLGPRAQAVVRPWLRADPEEYLFSASEAAEERMARRRKRPSKGRKARPKRAPRDHYDPESYCRAIARACKRAGVPSWHPHRIRHGTATTLRARYGLEVAQVVLGHATADVTQVYAETNRARAVEVMSKVG
jgi:integrase